MSTKTSRESSSSRTYESYNDLKKRADDLQIGNDNLLRDYYALKRDYNDIQQYYNDLKQQSYKDVEFITRIEDENGYLKVENKSLMGKIEELKQQANQNYHAAKTYDKRYQDCANKLQYLTICVSTNYGIDLDKVWNDKPCGDPTEVLALLKRQTGRKL